MRCQWDSFICLLPQWMRSNVDKLGKDSLQELRLREGKPPELITGQGVLSLERRVVVEDLKFCINTATKYSPWADHTSRQGYVTAPGGHRIGICGQAIISEGRMSGVSNMFSICIRIARDITGLVNKTIPSKGSVLIIGKPGSGKTTFLRDLIRFRSEHSNQSIAVVDEKMEIFPISNGRLCFDTGPRTDVLSGCNKNTGIQSVLRNMGPGTIALDEITAREDCDSLLDAAWCGVDLIATAHAGSKKELLERRIYKPLIETKLFETLIVLKEDKSWTMERM